MGINIRFRHIPISVLLEARYAWAQAKPVPTDHLTLQHIELEWDCGAGLWPRLTPWWLANLRQPTLRLGYPNARHRSHQYIEGGRFRPLPMIRETMLCPAAQPGCALKGNRY